MHQQDLQLRVAPTGEALYRHDPAETDEGVYFALGYRGKKVCIDGGLRHLLESFIGLPADTKTFSYGNGLLADFLQDYSKVWWKHPRTQELLEVVTITMSALRTVLAEEPVTAEQMLKTVLILSPHYKVPDDQSMGSTPLHVS